MHGSDLGLGLTVWQMPTHLPLIFIPSFYALTQVVSRPTGFFQYCAGNQPFNPGPDLGRKAYSFQLTIPDLENKEGIFKLIYFSLIFFCFEDIFKCFIVN